MNQAERAFILGFRRGTAAAQAEARHGLTLIEAEARGCGYGCGFSPSPREVSSALEELVRPVRVWAEPSPPAVGWSVHEVVDYYTGSHPERGGLNELVWVAIAPGVDLGVHLQHGNSSRSVRITVEDPPRAVCGRGVGEQILLWDGDGWLTPTQWEEEA